MYGRTALLGAITFEMSYPAIIAGRRQIHRGSWVLPTAFIHQRKLLKLKLEPGYFLSEKTNC